MGLARDFEAPYQWHGFIKSLAAVQQLA